MKTAVDFVFTLADQLLTRSFGLKKLPINNKNLSSDYFFRYLVVKYQTTNAVYNQPTNLAQYIVGLYKVSAKDFFVTDIKSRPNDRTPSAQHMGKKAVERTKKQYLNLFSLCSKRLLV